jgi:Ca2+-binding EF-hand superfamily protein
VRYGDVMRTGRISFQDFMVVLQTMGIILTQEQVNEVPPLPPTA